MSREVSALNGRDEAFRYAKGEPARSSLNNAEENRLCRPLDFAAVTGPPTDAVKHGKPLPANVPASVQQRAWTSPVLVHPQRARPRPQASRRGPVHRRPARRSGHPPDDRRPSTRRDRGGRTVRSVNLITGFEATLHYGVLAIAATLLVLDLAVRPAGHLAAAGAS